MFSHFTILMLLSVTAYAEEVSPCVSIASQPWASGGGGLANGSAQLLCVGSEDPIPAQCFRKARTTWKENGGDISDEQTAISLCEGTEDLTVFDCFRSARSTEGLSMGDEGEAIHYCRERAGILRAEWTCSAKCGTPMMIKKKRYTGGSWDHFSHQEGWRYESNGYSDLKPMSLRGPTKESALASLKSDCSDAGWNSNIDSAYLNSDQSADGVLFNQDCKQTTFAQTPPPRRPNIVRGASVCSADGVLNTNVHAYVSRLQGCKPDGVDTARTHVILTCKLDLPGVEMRRLRVPVSEFDEYHPPSFDKVKESLSRAYQPRMCNGNEPPSDADIEEATKKLEVVPAQ